MTLKNTMQIINIKNDYNIGVEVEMNHITREDAARLAADFFGTGHYEYTGNTDGYKTWSAWDDQGRKWKFVSDCSISGPASQQCELVTPILEYDDIPVLQELLRRLRKAGAVSNPNNGCGVHIHISRKGGFEVKDVKNLVNMMAAHEQQIGRAIWIDQRRTRVYCKVVSPKFLEMMKKKNPKTMSDLEHVWYEGNDANFGTFHHYNDSRYHMLNLHSFFNGHGTIEFRMFQFSNPHTGADGTYKRGGLHAGKMKAYIQLCIAMCERAHDARCISSKAQQTDNDKYAFKWFMMRLGMVGDEFKTARKLLLQNMEGDGTYRFDREGYACYQAMQNTAPEFENAVPYMTNHTWVQAVAV